jgi:hypothetical protein
VPYKNVFNKLYAVYSASPKNKAELESIALKLDITLNSIECWVPSNAHSVRVV